MAPEEPEQEPMTDEEHVEAGGEICPYCRSYEIEGGPVTIVERGAEQEVYCNDCDARWIDVYRLVGYAED